jgi:hypothetical protein
MPEIGWSAFVEKHPIAHLVAAIIPVNRAPVMPSYVQDLRQLIVRLVGRFNLSGDFAVKVEGETHAPALHDSPEIHTAFSRREDADKMATGLQARRVSEYTGWATQRQFLLDPLAALEIAAALSDAGVWDEPVIRHSKRG